MLKLIKSAVQFIGQCQFPGFGAVTSENIAFWEKLGDGYKVLLCGMWVGVCVHACAHTKFLGNLQLF